MGKKKYLLDTSIILDDIENLIYLYQDGENDIFISEVVLEELDKKKDLQNELGYFSREFFRAINSNDVIKNQCDSIADDMIYKMNFKNKTIELPLYIIYRPKYKTQNLDYGLNDSRILEIAKDYDFVLLTNDISLKMLVRMCNALDIKATLTLEDQDSDLGEIPNPIGDSISVELTSRSSEAEEEE